MVAERNLARIVRSWLRTDEHESADRVLENVLDLLDATPQRRPLWPARRIAEMPTFARLALGAAAIVAVVLVGFSLLPRNIGPGATPSVSPGPTPRLYLWPARLAAGTYATSFAWDIPVEVTFTVPPGWDSFDIEVSKNGHVSLAILLAEDVAINACEGALQEPRPGSSVDDLVAAIKRIDGIETTDVEDGELAGYPADHFGYVVSSSRACAEEASVLWTLPVDMIRPVAPLGPPKWPARIGSSSVWILSVNGTRLVVVAGTSPDATTSESFELQSVIDSLQFGPPLAAAPAACDIVVSGSRTTGGADAEDSFSVVMGPGQPGELLGPMPVDFPIQGSFARLDFRAGDAFTGSTVAGDRPGAGLVPPSDAATSGFSTATTVNGFQGSLLFDAPGTWWVRLGPDEGGCVTWFPVEVLPVGG